MTHSVKNKPNENFLGKPANWVTIGQFGAAASIVGLATAKRLSGSKAGLVAAGSFAALNLSWCAYAHLSGPRTAISLENSLGLRRLREVHASEGSSVRQCMHSTLGLANPQQPLADLDGNQLDKLSEIPWNRYKQGGDINRLLAGIRVRKAIGDTPEVKLPIVAPLTQLAVGSVDEDGEPVPVEKTLAEVDSAARDMYKEWLSKPTANFVADRGWDMTELSWQVVATMLSTFGMPSLQEAMTQRLDGVVPEAAVDIASTLLQDAARDKAVDYDAQLREQLAEKITVMTYPVLVEILRDSVLAVIAKGSGEGSLSAIIAPVLAGGVSQKRYELAARGTAAVAMHVFPKRQNLILLSLRASLFALGLAEGYLRTKREDAIIDIMSEAEVLESVTTKDPRRQQAASRVLYGQNIWDYEDDLNDEQYYPEEDDDEYAPGLMDFYDDYYNKGIGFGAML